VSHKRPRPTSYDGILMRSRLEAEFAGFLDETEQPWLYEERAYATRRGVYLPDFTVPHVFSPERPRRGLGLPVPVPGGEGSRAVTVRTRSDPRADARHRPLGAVRAVGHRLGGADGRRPVPPARGAEAGRDGPRSLGMGSVGGVPLRDGLPIGHPRRRHARPLPGLRRDGVPQTPTDAPALGRLRFGVPVNSMVALFRADRSGDDRRTPTRPDHGVPPERVASARALGAFVRTRRGSTLSSPRPCRGPRHARAH
jgi:hypothetical protein